MSFTVDIGFPEPIGASKTDNGVNFAVAVGDGESCSLILYKKGSDKIAEEIPFTEEMMYGNVYAMVVYNLDIKAYDYNFRIAGRVVIDPYARKLSGTSVWGETDNVSVKSVVTDEVFDWEGDRPLGLLFEDSIIYRLHVRGFTKHSSSKVSKKGTFKGIEEKLPYLKELGINMINLMPAYEFYEVQSNNYTHISAEKNMINYWGYTEGNYFAPKASFAATGKDGGQIEEFKQLVKACHMNGIEVCMEFFFPEGVNQNLILECFRFWVREYHIDGIQSNIGNDVKSILKNDAVLGRTKLISYEWNEENDGSYRMKTMTFKNLGEANDGFLITARRFLKSDEGQVGDVSYRFKNNHNKVQVINYFSRTGTFCLNDMVSFERKHNEANGENNTDGTDYNYSWNCGVEGKTRKRKVMELRKKQIRNMWIFLLCSQGTPMIYAGDEFLNTSQGNNNPYCQDNEISWLNWNLAKKNEEYIQFVKQMISFRKANKILHMKDEMRIMDYKSIGLPDISYHGSKAWYLDYNHLNRHIGIMYCGNYSRTDMGQDIDNIYIAYNMYWEDMTFGLPSAGKGKVWKKFICTNDMPDTSDDAIIEKEAVVPPRSVTIFVSEKDLRVSSAGKKNKKKRK